MTNDDQALIEQLAEIEHEQWSFWARALLTQEPGLSAERAQRWRCDLIPYQKLSEAQKELDRVWARRVVTLVRQGATA